MTGVLEQLLALQDLDVRLDLLRHRKARHPLQADIDAISAEASAHQVGVDQVEAQRHELARELKRLEDEVALLTARKTEVDGRLYDGSVTATKDLLALQHEIATLGDRQRGLEDEELELMERLEPLDAELERLGAIAAGIESRRSAKAAELDEALVDVDHEIAELGPQREALAAALPPDLLTDYDRRRADLGGVAVARLLRGATCDGCHLTMSAMDVDRIKHQPADATVTCPECSRILVR